MPLFNALNKALAPLARALAPRSVRHLAVAMAKVVATVERANSAEPRQALQVCVSRQCVRPMLHPRDERRFILARFSAD
jgi:hypothetical protein